MSPLYSCKVSCVSIDSFGNVSVTRVRVRVWRGKGLVESCLVVGGMEIERTKTSRASKRQWQMSQKSLRKEKKDRFEERQNGADIESETKRYRAIVIVAGC